MPNILIRPNVQMATIDQRGLDEIKKDIFKGENVTSFFLVFDRVEVDIYFSEDPPDTKAAFSIEGTLPVSFLGNCVINFKSGTFSNDNIVSNFCENIINAIKYRTVV